MQQNNCHLFSILFFLLLMTAACSPTKEKANNDKMKIAIIPRPEKLVAKSGSFEVNETTILIAENESPEVQYVLNYLNGHFEKAAGFRLALGSSGQNAIVFSLNENIQHQEGYQLNADTKQINISASQPEGLFYGVQTLLQLLPPEIYTSTVQQNIELVVPAVEIEDAPRFSYRGLHLDVGRHFFNVEEVKKYIDALAYHKMNTFHWHLTEDQGWRIEIKQYPKLTEVGAYRNGTLIGHYSDQPHQFDGKRYGGFYTQEEVKEVVQYAKERFITVIPEIELPGHAQAALAAYPELACTEGPFEVWQLWGVSENVYCPKEETFQFLENVLTEVIGLFPSHYIHIGGDECPKKRWEESQFCQELMKREGLKDEHELQSWFISRIEKFVNSKGRSIIGWDEILEGGLAPNATVMSWRGEQGGIEAAKQKHDVIMTPTTYCYFDYYQSDHPGEPLAIGGFLPLKKVYAYNPIPEELATEESKYILGVQGNLWSEYIKTYDKVEYMVYPRATALAEVAWSQSEHKNFEDFTKRLGHHFKRFGYAGINAANHLYELDLHAHATGTGIEIELKALADDAAIYYTTDGTAPTQQSNLYDKPFPLSDNATIKAQAFLNGKKAGRSTEQTVHLHKAAGKSITLKSQPAPIYSASGNTALINGINASGTNFNDGEWLGFVGDNFEAVVNLGEVKSIEKIKLRFFNDNGSWIYLPVEVMVYTSKNGNDFKQQGAKKVISGEHGPVSIQFAINETQAQYVKILAKNFGGHPKTGAPVWLFVDEIVVE